MCNKTLMLGATALALFLVAAILADRPSAEDQPAVADPGSQQSNPPVVQSREIVMKGEGERTEEEIIQITEAMIHDYDEMGRYWIRVLEDEEGKLLTREYENDLHRRAAINQRQVYAAKMLGKLRYPPAIPVLIKHIRLLDANAGPLSDELKPFVCKIGLANYGNAAVPQIVEAYLDDTSREMRGHYSEVFDCGGTRKVFKDYFLGLQAQGDKRIIKEDLEYIRHIR